MDRLRSYPHWLATRNLSNEASDESVQALVEAVKARYELPRRWYRTKAKLLGIDRLADYDRMAVVGADDEQIGWDEGRELVLETFDSVSPRMSEIAGRFFDERWIDVPPRPSKRGGAFSASTVPSVHPYVMLNWTDRRRDVTTLAHELGHGIHQYLAREQGVFHQSTPLTVAETASVFAEELVFGRLLGEADDAALAAQPARRVDRGPDRDGLPPDRDEPVRGPRPQRPPRRGRALGRALRRALGRVPGGAARRLGRGHRRLPLAGGPTSPTSSARPATSTPTPTGSCWRCRSTASTSSAARRSSPTTSRCSPAAARARPRSSAGSSASTSPTPRFWDRGLDLVAEQLDAAEAAAEEVMAADDASRLLLVLVGADEPRLLDHEVLDLARAARARLRPGSSSGSSRSA